MEELQRMGMSRDRVEQMRNMIQQNMQGMREQIEQFAGERIAENMSERPRGEGVDNLMNRPFNALSDADKKALQNEVKRLAAMLRTRIALRQKRAKSGQLDPKATIRANLKYHGVPIEIHPKDRGERGDPVCFMAHAQRALQHRPRLVIERFPERIHGHAQRRYDPHHRRRR